MKVYIKNEKIKSLPCAGVARVTTVAKLFSGSDSLYTNEELSAFRDAIDTYLSNLPKPHPHAELMALYAKDAAETDKPWERWEAQPRGQKHWLPLVSNPEWIPDLPYRRKEGL